MKKLIYIFLLFCCTSSVLQAVNEHRTVENMEFPASAIDNRTYKIYSTSQTIYIDQLESSSYVMVFDSSGRNVFKGISNSGSLSIPVRSKGIFIIRIEKDKNIFTRKILVK